MNMNSIDSPSKHKDLTQSNKPQPTPESTRSSLFPIDLNEIPSSSDSFDIVRSFHDDNALNPPPPRPPISPPSIPTGPSSSSSSCCGACGLPEEDAPSGLGHVVVCDGCERGFHLACAGVRALGVEDWVCGECEKRGVKSQAWPLGFKAKKKRVLDMNASPPSDGDGDTEGSERRVELRKQSFGDNPLGRNPFDSLARHSSFPFAGKGFDFEKVVGFLNHPMGISYDHNRHNVQTGCRNFEVNLGFPVGNLSSKNLAIGLYPRNPSDVFLQALREFIFQRHGVLDHGWHVEFKQPTSNCGIEAVYCAPNGMKFESMSEVASYLGLGSNHILGEKTINREGLDLQGKFHVPRKRKYSSRSLGTNVFSEGKGHPTQTFRKDFSSDNQCTQVIVSNGDNVKATESCSEENSCLRFQQSYEGLPLQFEDFFLLSLGEIDLRPSYHDIHQIWPVGYRSCWHDRVTGSLLFCEVLDGGDCGPVFKIRRCSCSSVPLPNRSTIIFRQEPEQNAALSVGESGNVVYSCVDSEECIQMMLADPIPPQENEILSCFEGSLSAACDIMTNGTHSEAGSISAYHDYDFRDAIGEISIEEKSSSSAWMKLSQEFVNAYVDICDKKGSVKLYCKHVKHETPTLNQDRRDENSRSNSEALMKFCSSPFMLGSTLNDGKTDLSIDVLKSWLGQDRFGLDTEFVQEIIEHLPGVKHCSRYELLHSRNNYSELFTVGNGKLIKRKDTLEIGDKEAVDQQTSLDETHEKCIPTGTPLCSKLPPELVGDYYQVWEVLRRFHEILGLKEPLPLNELEDAIVNPWSDYVHHIGNIETESQRSQVSSMNSVDRGDDRISSSSNASSSGVCGDSTYHFIRMEKELATSLATSVSGMNSRCFGATLTVVHSLLLGVLIGELQSKVAALVYPNFDIGDFKPKRGRRKDVDSSVLAKKMKLNLLPINELSWPELARRYILATLSMDGSSDISDDSRKVFRCLQGDGGVLCGSVTGIAGIEADALLLAEAMKKIFGPLSRENVLVMEEDTVDSDACERSLACDSNLPEWAQALIPVKKLPTNVGTRIRKCVYDALEKGPPDWAKERLEHSISKEIYKGNASGPTKKAVLSVLEDMSAERLPQKPEERKKRKRVIDICNIIMKQCQVILRQAAAEDEEKRFCNLLGRKLMNSSDNDDGLLGSPAMVARPLDFRTIDRRLAAGAYGGSHEAFLEDVRELWNNLHMAFSDKPDLVDLASRLSQHFELLYEEELVPVIERLAEYAKLDSLDRETKNEIDEFLSSLSELPKAPWDEGVCKVCGVDRDDDSVLLCDTCDAEYHMYCLDPPLARIPEGNWYCPSCVVDRKIVQDVSVLSRVFRRHRGKKYQEVTCDYLESLSHLASVMEEKEFREYSMAERIFLLKFLCDELLNSALVRQHLEQCGEVSAELQQKLRSLSLDYRNLKAKEEFLALRVGKDDVIVLGTAGELPLPANSGQCVALEQHDRVLRQQIDDGKDNTGSNGFDKNSSEKFNLSYDETSDTTETGGQVKDIDTAGRGSKLPGNHLSCTASPITDLLHEEANGSAKVSPEKTLNVQTSLQEIGLRSDACGPKEPVAYDVELKSVKKEISVLQDSINSLELQLLNVALRREFLGSDSIGRLYWAAAMPGRGMHIIVDGSLMARKKQKISESRGRVRSSLQECTYSAETHPSVEGSKAPCPFLHEANRPMSVSPTWISYQTDSEIDELLEWFNDTDVKERSLKEAILHWLKFRLRDDQCKDLATDVQKRTISLLPGENFFSLNLATKAVSMLEKNHGPCLEPETVGIVKKRGKKTKVTSEGKMYRCECLEPIWSSRYHCPVCHKTFLKAVDIEEHTNEKSCVPFLEKCKVTANNRKGNLKAPAAVSGGMIERNIVDKNDCLQQSKLSNFQNDGLVCPYDLEEISARFVTEDSSTELVQQIGLIGSKGNLIFVSSISPHLDDITLVIPSSVTSEAQDKINTSETQIFERSSESPGRKKHETKNTIKSGASSGKRERNCSIDPRAAELGVDICCIVPQSSLKPLTGKHSEILRQLKIALLDMDAAVSEIALRSSKACLERRWMWRSFVKSAETIYEMIQATIIFEDMIKTQYLRNDWWYWSSLSAAARTSTLSALALRIYSLDSAILYEKTMPELDSADNCKSSGAPDNTPQSNPDSTEKPRPCRKSNRKRKEPES